ncbi:PepSY domain-containing protein [Ferrimonas futtsuensis]|uniref:PepSY domain-containing protein n=1 Tax=Ferrimonas futtsuensis TaxID=364764 RepID=UPI000427EB2D|nr:PepSY domain-containing protein [Ferrimonas futtsuensis]
MLAKLHRYLAALVALPLLLVIFSGLLLALTPLLTPDAETRPTPAQFQQTLETLEQQQGPIRFAFALPEHQLVMVAFESQKGRQFLDLYSGEPAELPWQFQLSRFAKGLHVNLLVDANWLVELSTWVMLFLSLSGLFLARPKSPKGAMGWHTALGWYGAPLMLVVTVTGLLMLHPMGGEQPKQAPHPSPMSLDRAFAKLDEVDVAAMRMVRRPPQGVTLYWENDQGTRWQWQPDQQQSAVTQPTRWTRILHDGSFGGRPAAFIYALLCISALVLWGTGFYNWVRRARLSRPTKAPEGACHLVAYASQTGSAAELAKDTGSLMESRGDKVHLCSLAQLKAEDLSQYLSVRLLISTCGDGEMPIQGQDFLESLKRVSLKGVSYQLLGLGDSRYAKFCQAAHDLDGALRRSGASLVGGLALADGDPTQVWQRWAGATDSEQPQSMANTVSLRLEDKMRLDDGQGHTRETWRLRFSCAEPLSYRCGDLLKLRPAQGGTERAYSIASAPDGNGLEICVTLHQWQLDDAPRIGLMSGQLCHESQVGDLLEGRIAAHPGFRLPEDCSPIIMVAAGCGIAPFMGFIRQRPQLRNWLLFGNRHRQGDFLYGDQLLQHQQSRALDHLDLAFSRDQQQKVYAQDRLEQNPKRVGAWLELGAHVYVCGHQSLGEGVRQALLSVFISQGSGPEQAQEQLDQLIKQGRYHEDLF